MIDYTNLTTEKAATLALASLVQYKNLKLEHHKLELKVIACADTADERNRYFDLTDLMVDAKWNAMQYMRFVFHAENYDCQQWIENELEETMQDLADIARGDY